MVDNCNNHMVLCFALVFFIMTNNLSPFLLLDMSSMMTSTWFLPVAWLASMLN